ncbi:2-C-methyl-D-erythritol 4-phosphate cytidylyltransferase [Nitrosomonas supralitoralis]|uniref:2-C-methyl-D-erythritol 4-phosphate cytidylyltransferase n=1 Tax=Nitrosomonas supralitoralis TaxID=2116706 RepID=A0A2P7NUD3_9PROT|nr:2-C-methyl-D-erythritol 4-phosphate cytidylyltransferase [Nitrosomonas supralitoralis]PSJ17049.1 2-C-methyl-D-erythritol 4-phosphate cytidylyltransferase [Nitrosomonas supralitoralis]
MSNFFALIPAAGSGSRMNSEVPKQYLALNNKPMIYHSINMLYHNQLIKSIFIVLASDDCDWIKYDWSEFSSKLIVLTCGGATRADSVLNGLTTAKLKGLIDTSDWILVHDAARPCLTSTLLEKLINELTQDEVGGLLAVPVSDTLKRSNLKSRVMQTESRENIWQAQTPQMFRYELLTKALQNAEKLHITDDASAIEALGFFPKLILSDTYNFKVTYPKDLALAELIIQQRINT